MRLTPIIQEVANDKGLHLLFSVVDSGLVWADPALDITTEVIQKFDAVGGGAAAEASGGPGAETRGGGAGPEARGARAQAGELERRGSADH